MYRNLTRQEKTQVHRAFSRWGVYEALADKPLLVQDSSDIINNNRNYYQGNVVASAALKTIYLATPEIEYIAVNTQPSLAGLAIGHLKKQFMPTMAGADLFARLAQNNNNDKNNNNKFYVTVNENAEKLVLYGRDVMGESIVSASEQLNQNDLVILLNTKNEAIGIGKTRFSGKLILRNGKVTITTLVDAGYYLRDEGR